jgi:hypothetical protein
MSLSRNRVNAQIAVSDKSEAERFYEGKLGLAKGEGSREASWGYPSGDGSVLYLREGHPRLRLRQGRLVQGPGRQHLRARAGLTRRRG